MAHSLKLPWIRLLRWTAVAGQTGTVLYVIHGLHIPLPTAQALSVIGLAALTNLALHALQPGRGESPGFLAGVLMLDVALLTVLLRLTGGPHNPFAVLYLVLVALAAVALTPALTWGIAALSCLGYSYLFLAASGYPAPGDPVCGVGPNLPLPIHLRGMMVAFAVTAVLVAAFASHLQHVLRRQQEDLAAARLEAAQNERFAAMATLAAGAAHELGTPLASIVVAAGEVAREAERVPGHPSLIEDAQLIRREAFRCRSILDRLQNHAEDTPRAIDPEKILDTLRTRFPSVAFVPPSGKPLLSITAPPEALTQALTNLITNALDASPQNRAVQVAVRQTDDAIAFCVTDRGPGLDESARTHAGEPFFTTKPAGKGMGLGLFLVRLLARRLSGEFRFETPAGGGTQAILSLPTILRDRRT